MGRTTGKTEKQNHHVRTVWKTVERDVKRNELDVIAGICETDRTTVGLLVASATTSDGYEAYENDNDERTTEQHDERASSSAATVNSWVGSPEWNHRL